MRATAITPSSVPYLVSADNHINSEWLPADLWTSRCKSTFSDKVPRVVETEAGSFWMWEGKVQGKSAAGSSNASLTYNRFSPMVIPDGELPPSHPETALKHLKHAGISAGVFYGDGSKWKIEDAELRQEAYRIYNNFMLENTDQSDGQLLYLPTIPSHDPAACQAEVERLITAGTKAVEFSVFDAGEPLNSLSWWPLWETLCNNDITLCSHSGRPSGQPRRSAEQGNAYIDHSIMPFAFAKPIAEMIFGGVFVRFPSLRWTIAEIRIGWLPFLFERMDRQLEIRNYTRPLPDGCLPSDLIRRNISFTFEYDRMGAQMLAHDWSCPLADVVMWGCDYPHPQNIWPNPWPSINEMFGCLEPDLIHDILYRRACHLFGFSLQDSTDHSVAVAAT
jgi:predicted TIM-barrel fold metal-dependent hydrolase